LAAFDIQATLKALQSYMAASGHVKDVVIGEPKSPPRDDTVFAAVWMDRVRVAELTLLSTIEVHSVTVRIYRKLALGDNQATQAAPEESETDMAQSVQVILEAFMTDADLGASIRNIDLAGEYGEGVLVDFGHVNLSGIMYRVADITLPCIVDGSASQAL
jgi:hypothetical protein